MDASDLRPMSDPEPTNLYELFSQINRCEGHTEEARELIFELIIQAAIDGDKRVIVREDEQE